MRTNQKANKNSILFRIVAVLLVSVLFTTQLLSGMFARFINSDDSAEKARVAAFVFDVEDREASFEIDLSNIKAPGDEVKYIFAVKNSNQMISEVDQTYTITLKEFGSLPLSVNCSLGDEVKQSFDSSISETTRTLTGSFEAAKAEEHVYTLTVKWPESKNDVKYSSGSGVASMSMHIVCEQTD